MRVAGLSDYLIGAAFLLAVLSACTAAGVLVVTRRLAHLRGLLRGLAIFLVATAAVWAVHLLPALVGVLSAWTVGICAVLVLAGAWATPARIGAQPPDAREPPREREPRLSQLSAVAGVAAVAISAVAYLLARSPSPMSIDVIGNHLPQITRWIQSGTIWELTAFSADLSHATYPQNGNVLLLAATLPWKSAFVTGYVPVVFHVATAVAVYALAREVGGPRSTSALAGAGVVALPILSVTALQEVMIDPPMLAWGTIGALFLVRAGRSGDVSELLLAGCGLGLAFGTKWYAVPYVPVLFVAWLLARRRQGAETLRDASLLAGAIAVFGGVWLIRNWALTGDPLHPARIAPFGIDLVDAPRDVARERYGYKVSDYVFDAGAWREFLFPAYRQTFGLLGALMMAGAVGAVVVARRQPAGATAAIAGSSLAMLLLYVFVVPDTAYGRPGEPLLVVANARYLLPALVGAAVLTAWLGRNAGRWRPLLDALLLLCILLAGPRWAAGPVPAADLLAATVLVAGLVGAARWRPGALSLRRAALVAGVAVLAAGWGVWRGDWWRTYGGYDPAIAVTQRVAPSGGRVAFAGEWGGGVSPVQPAFGRRLDNRVDYVGRFEQGVLRKAGREAFLRQLRRIRYDVLVAGTGNPPRPAGDQPEVRWAQEAGYRVRSRSIYFVALTPR